jgi:hypothetical protein
VKVSGCFIGHLIFMSSVVELGLLCQLSSGVFPQSNVLSAMELVPPPASFNDVTPVDLTMKMIVIML